MNIKKTHEHEIRHKNEEKNYENSLCSLTLGSNELPFSLTVQSIIDMLKVFSIERFELIDRKRDEHGNVIKNNIYLDEYQKWYQERESTNYIEYMNNQSQYVENNRNQFINIFQEFNQQLQDQLRDQVPNSNLDNLYTQNGATGTSFSGNSQENNMQGPMFLFQNIMNNYNQNNVSSEEDFSDVDVFEDNDDRNDQDIDIREDNEELENNDSLENNDTDENNEIENDNVHRNLNNQSESTSSSLPQNNINPYQSFLQNLNNNPSYQEFSNQLLQNLSQSNFQNLYNQSNQQQIPHVHFYMPTVLGSQTLSNPNINLSQPASNLYTENQEYELDNQENNNEIESTLSNNNENNVNIENNNNVMNNDDMNNNNMNNNDANNDNTNNDETNNDMNNDQNHPNQNNENLNQSDNLNFHQFNQQIMEQFTNELIKDTSGSVCVMDIYTGDVVAMVSSPMFDSNKFVHGISQKDWNNLMCGRIHGHQCENNRIGQRHILMLGHEKGKNLKGRTTLQDRYRIPPDLIYSLLLD